MKKILLTIIFLVVIFVVSIFGILFTQTGNDFISSYLENRINNEQTDLKIDIKNFTLTTKKVNLEATINENSYVNIFGDLSIFKKSVDLKYDVKIVDLSIFKNLINEDLKGSLSTNGIFKGNSAESIVQGFSNLASSQTKYYVNLANFKIKDIYLDIKDAKIDELLAVLHKPIYANGNLTLNANIKNIDKNSLDGLLSANISKGLVNNEVINKQFNTKISTKVTFDSNINASLLGKIIDIKSEVFSSVANIFFNKTLIDIENNSIKSDYKLDIKNLAKLEGLIGKKLNGEFLTSGNITKEGKNILIDGNSDIFDGSFAYKLNFSDFEAKNINLKIEKAKLEKIFTMLNEPIYMIGNLQLDGDIKNFNLEKLDGNSIIKISDAKVINEVVNTVFKQNLKDTISLESEIKTSFIPNQAISNININSNIAKINMQKAIYDFAKKSFYSDYDFNILNLESLESFTKAKMRGALDIKGNIKSSESSLKIDGASKIANGNMKFDLQDSDLSLVLADSSFKDLSYMLFQPEIFDAKTNLDLKYNLASKEGIFNANLLNGNFLLNDFTNIVNKLIKHDLTKDIYETTTIHSKINDKKFVSDLIMKSKNSQIETTEALLDFEKNIIDSKFRINIKDNNFLIRTKGNIEKPDITLDVTDLLKNKIDKKLKNNKDKIEEKLNKVLKDKDSEETKELIKNIKSFF